MAPPESSVDSLNNVNPIDPADVSRNNYLDKIDRYVQKVEAFKVSPRQADVKGLRCDIALLVPHIRYLRLADQTTSFREGTLAHKARLSL